MSLLKIENLSYGIGEKTLYDNCNFTLNPKEHLGIVGKNGVGKSTLIKICMGKVSPDDGLIQWENKTDIGYLDQYADIDKDLTINEYLQLAFKELHDLENEMIQCYEKSVDDEKQFDRAVEIQTILESKDFYNLNVLIEKVASGLGVTAIGLDKRISEISGGQRAKVILAKLLLEKPDVLLLDEPTNFLDTSHVDWLADYLNSFDKAFIVVSHNMNFLDKITTHILEINNHTFTKFTGNYSSYLKQKELMVDDYSKRYEKQKKQIDKMEDFIRRNIAGSNSKNARGRRKQLERMEKMAPPAQERPKPNFSFNLISCSPQQKLEINNLTIGYPNNKLISNISFTISGQDKVVIKGFNGIGKSTLLKTLMGIIKPLEGQFSFSDTIKKIYYEQDLVWENPSYTPIDIVKEVYPKFNEKEIRTILARHGLSNKDVMQSITSLSGGEQAKVKLCLLSQKPTNFIILDEPTNHLDVQAKEVLKETLKNYAGTILLVSHEPEFYESIATKIIDISKYLY